MGLFDFFRKKKSQPEKPLETFVGPTIFYHEDDYRQVEIIPNDNLSNLKAESKKVEEFAKENFDGTGFTNMYVRSDKDKIELNQRKINPEEFEKIISQLGLERIPNVLTGYGQIFRELHKDCIGFGKDYTAIYYDFKDNVVQHIWLTNHWSLDKEKLGECLLELGKRWNLLLQDWNLTVTIDLKDKSEIENYLHWYDKE